MADKDNKKCIDKIQKQKKEREDSFKNTERGWLGLVGLYWLRDGENTIGSDKKNDILLPADVPKRVGIV